MNNYTFYDQFFRENNQFIGNKHSISFSLIDVQTIEFAPGKYGFDISLEIDDQIVENWT